MHRKVLASIESLALSSGGRSTRLVVATTMVLASTTSPSSRRASRLAQPTSRLRSERPRAGDGGIPAWPRTTCCRLSARTSTWRSSPPTRRRPRSSGHGGSASTVWCRDQLLVWMTVRADGSLPLGGAAPLLIERSSNVNPAAALPPSGLVLRTLRVRHPEPVRVVALLAKIGLASRPSVIVTEGAECTLSAEIETPTGLRRI